MATGSENADESQEDGPPQEAFLDALYEFANEEKDPYFTVRQQCKKCRRPPSVCWCPFLPKEPVDVDTTVYIIQHPFEEGRKLKTAPMLFHSLPEGKCHIVRGKRFSSHRFPELDEVLRSPNTLLLYPGEDAVDITELCPLDAAYNLVVLDGTWSQAKGLYTHNKIFKCPKKVQIKLDCKSKYVIRTQPVDTALSTLESAAIALSVLERKPHLVDELTRPLEALCNFQLQHGAVPHQSKEYKIANGLWTKPLPQKLLKQKRQETLEKETETGNIS